MRQERTEDKQNQDTSILNWDDWTEDEADEIYANETHIFQ